MTSAYNEVEVYVGNETYKQLICEFDAGTNVCKFTAYYTGAYENQCGSVYKFGDGGTAIGDDSGSLNKDCSIGRGSPTVLYNQGMIRGVGDFTPGNNDPVLYCGDVRDAYFCATCDFTIMAWGKLLASEQSLNPSVNVGNHFFWKNDDRPRMGIQSATNATQLNFWYTTVTPTHSIIGTRNFWTYDKWNFVAVSHTSSDYGYVFGNGELQAESQMYTSYSPGSMEYIGAESYDATPNRNFGGYIDELRICNFVATKEILDAMYKYKTGTFCVYVNDSNGDFDELCFNKDLDEPIILNGNNARFFDNNVYLDLVAEDYFNISFNVSIDGLEICTIEKNASTQVCQQEIILSEGDYVMTATATDQANRTTTKEYPIKVVKSVTINTKADSENVTMNFISSLQKIIWRIFS